MSQLSVLYDEYITNESEEVVEKSTAMDAIAELLPAKDYARFEEDLNRAEDKMSEDAFKAGFKAAILLIMEVLA